MANKKDDAQIVRALVFRGVGEPLAVEQITLDPPESTEILVRMRAVGLCHTEQHVIKGEMPVGMTPMVLGHEGAGIVESVGSDVRGIVVGDHVALLWRPICKQCEPCQRGDHHRCHLGDDMNLGPQFNGSYRRHDASGAVIGSLCMTGAFADKTVVDQASVVVVDRDIPFEVVALASCSAVAGYGAVTHATHVTTGDTVLVIGAGGQGSVAIQAARMAGASRVLVADHHQRKLDLASKLGASETILVTEEGELAAKVASLTKNLGVDHAIVCAGSVDALTQAYRSTKAGGSVVLSGIPPVTATSIPLQPIEVLGGNGKVLMGSQYGALSQFIGIPQVLDHHRCGRLQIQSLITRTYSLEDIAKGYDDLARGEPGRGLLRFD
ncbi:alcohol dehydrogenase class III family [Pyrenochaeta sp. DS3sAY3a]|nr:alcohol dehydrogenase class III family [Pyrenochaeta sp. DS3sAY3a]